VFEADVVEPQLDDVCMELGSCLPTSFGSNMQDWPSVKLINCPVSLLRSLLPQTQRDHDRDFLLHLLT